MAAHSTHQAFKGSGKTTQMTAGFAPDRETANLPARRFGRPPKSAHPLLQGQASSNESPRDNCERSEAIRGNRRTRGRLWDRRVGLRPPRDDVPACFAGRSELFCRVPVRPSYLTRVRNSLISPYRFFSKPNRHFVSRDFCLSADRGPLSMRSIVKPTLHNLEPPCPGRARNPIDQPVVPSNPP